MSRRGSDERGLGFSLLELVIVIAIIAVLLALLTPVFRQALEQAQGLAGK